MLRISVLQVKSGISAPCLIHPIAHDTLPTYHKTNKFTQAYQSIIDAYGVSCYKEVNPGNNVFIINSFTIAKTKNEHQYKINGLLMC